MEHTFLDISDSFEEIDTRTIDDRNRLTIGKLLEGSKRVKVFKNKKAQLILRFFYEC